jgi:hypothetical protein
MVLALQVWVDWPRAPRTINKILARGVNLPPRCDWPLAAVSVICGALEEVVALEAIVIEGIKRVEASRVETACGMETTSEVDNALRTFEACSFPRWLFVRVTKEVGDEIEGNVAGDDKLNGADTLICIVLGKILKARLVVVRLVCWLGKDWDVMNTGLDWAPRGCRSDTTAAASRVGFGWFLPGNGLALWAAGTALGVASCGTEVRIDRLRLAVALAGRCDAL